MPPTPLTEIPRPIPASRLDSHYRLRKGSALRAARAGLLAAVFRRGRGGQQCYVLPASAEKWFLDGLPTESKP